MKKKFIVPILILAICSSGCTSLILRKNTYKQTTTISDFLTDEVLYNLIVYKEYYDGTQLNAIPSFAQLTTGQSTVQQTAAGQVSPKITTGVSETDLQFTGTHQVQDNWTITPIVDPNILNRLYLLYRSQFTNISSADLSIIFPTSPQALDAQGRPLLKYFPKFDSTGTNVVIVNDKPQFTAIQIPVPPARHLSDIPGAVIDKNRNHNKGWFAFDAPPSSCPSWKMGPYFVYNVPRFVWVTNKENFFNFALLALGGTNVYIPNQSSFTIQNGIAVPSFQFQFR